MEAARTGQLGTQPGQDGWEHHYHLKVHAGLQGVSCFAFAPEYAAVAHWTLQLLSVTLSCRAALRLSVESTETVRRGSVRWKQ